MCGSSMRPTFTWLDCSGWSIALSNGVHTRWRRSACAGSSALALVFGALASVRGEGEGEDEDVGPAHAARRRAIDPSAATVAVRGHRASPPGLWTYRCVGPFMR